MTFKLHKTGKNISANFSVLGLNLSNNGSICVMRDGVIDFYLESERITRKKRDHAIRSLIKYVHDIDAIAICDSDWVRESKILLSALDLSIVKNKFPDAEIFDYRLEHHKCHAASAFYSSGYDDAIAIVVDSNGSKIKKAQWEMVEIESIFDVPSWKVLYKKYWSPEDIGIGKKFEDVCVRYGFHKEDAGKVMGLAAYGKPEAYYVQQAWENRALELCTMYKDRNLVLSGGCFLNCVVNYKLQRELDVSFRVMPIAHDGGTAIGAAYLATLNKSLAKTHANIPIKEFKDR
tara:strand:- start:299 stop:1168 length:870 start_codon:yes stop_codon:yes gene_type:complete